jgi:hypothetical protein
VLWSIVSLLVQLFLIVTLFTGDDTTLKVDNGGFLGDWTFTQNCADEHYAVGFDLKVYIHIYFNNNNMVTYCFFYISVVQLQKSEKCALCRCWWICFVNVR